VLAENSISAIMVKRELFVGLDVAHTEKCWALMDPKSAMAATRWTAGRWATGNRMVFNFIYS